MALRVRNALNVNTENEPQTATKRLSGDDENACHDAKRPRLCPTGSLGLQEVTNRNTRLRNTRVIKDKLHGKAKENAEPLKKKTKILLPNLMKSYKVIEPVDYYFGKEDLPEGVEDMDLKVICNINCEPQYAHENFIYHRSREDQFLAQPYTDKQREVTATYRSLLVDWMVEVQESFELNHETLYLAVKIVDHYLAKTDEIVGRANLQLLGCTAILIACKLDERIPPSLDDFVYICDDAYKKDEIKTMEVKVLTCLNFNLNMPLSYSFLRRFARSIDLTMRELTLARYILETSLLDYTLIGTPDSLLAAGSLLLALDMLGIKWNDTLVYYTGYERRNLISVRSHLASLIQSVQKNRQTRTIFSKYSHEVFHQVASIKLPEDLVEV